MSWGCASPSVNESTAERSSSDFGPKTRILSISPMRASAYSISPRSCSAIASMPTSARKSTAAPIPIAPAMFGVPASNLCGTSAQVLSSRPTVWIISPPPWYGAIASSSSFRAHRTPMPVGPHILWPLNA